MMRRWMAFGVVLLVVNVITIVVGTVLLFRWHWLLGTIFLVVLAAALVRRLPVREDATARSPGRARTRPATSRPPSRRACTASACSRPSGAASTPCRSSPRQAETLRETELRKARAIGVIWFWLVLLPDIAFALCLGAGI